MTSPAADPPAFAVSRHRESWRARFQRVGASLMVVVAPGLYLFFPAQRSARRVALVLSLFAACRKPGCNSTTSHPTPPCRLLMA